MFVQSVEFIRAHANGNGNRGKAKGDISIYGQESNYTTWRLAKMNLALRGIDGQIAHGDTFHNDRHPDLKADFILANPPFNVSDWRGELLRNDKRWKYGVPPTGNANFAWVQHMIYHLAPTGLAGFVLANGSMSSNQSGEGEIRKNIIEADLVDCMVALPGQLFYSTQIPACLWFIARDKRGQPSPRPPLPAGEGHYRGEIDIAGAVERARELRRAATPAEVAMWELLRDRRFLGLKFRRQHQFGDYILDFYCDERKLVIELDGAAHESVERGKIDHKRDSYLKSSGLTVLRFENKELFDDPERVLSAIAGSIAPSPRGRGSGVRGTGFRDRRGEVLFIDARKLGEMVDRTHKELTDEEVTRIARTYHAWRGEKISPSPIGRGAEGEGVAVYRDIPGFCKSATLEEIRKHGHVLTPGRYVGAEAQEDDGEPFEEKMQRLTASLEEQFTEGRRLEDAIRENLRSLGYTGMQSHERAD
jgi:type I restriction-modification system DNA methylase subunit